MEPVVSSLFPPSSATFVGRVVARALHQVWVNGGGTQAQDAAEQLFALDPSPPSLRQLLRGEHETVRSQRARQPCSALVRPPGSPAGRSALAAFCTLSKKRNAGIRPQR